MKPPKSFFDPETLKEFASSLSEIKETSAGSMRESENKLSTAASSNSSEASQSMMQSVESQERALEELRKVLAKFSEQLDRLEARTLAQRLTKLEKTEKKLSMKLVSIMPSSVVSSHLNLITKTSVPFMKWKKPKSKSVQMRMKLSKKLVDTMKELKSRIWKSQSTDGRSQPQKRSFRCSSAYSKNVSFQALDNLNYWESSFEKWAKLLEQESPGGDSAGGGAKGKTEQQTF